MNDYQAGQLIARRGRLTLVLLGGRYVVYAEGRASLWLSPADLNDLRGLLNGIRPGPTEFKER